MDLIAAWLVGLTLLSFLSSHLYHFLAIRFGIIAHVNWRSAHLTSTPTGSGIVLVILFLTFAVGFWVYGVIGRDILLVILGPCLVGVTGYFDDRDVLTILVRLPVYLLAACWCIFWLGFPDINILGFRVGLGFAGLLFGTVSLLWLQNLFNFMDGIDGIAASEVVFVCFAAVLINAGSDSDWLLVSLLTGCLAFGFLFINWPKAKLFMGDAGSSFFGLMLGVCALSDDFLPVWVWMILLCQFLVDACLTVSVRLLSGKKIYEAHSLHAYQHLNRRFGTPRTLILVIVVNVIWLFPIAVLAFEYTDFGFILLLLAAIPIMVKDWMCGAGSEAPAIKYLRVT